ncbi:tail fiber protein [Candidatus Accumulibacter sp. ACC003]|uniref:phage tail protein n=1 Tax=Candidatus Accumulibacter sp. ACC003 TaxID=2823334 RepID=UPI0025C2F3A9|nr:tail fiber protein [Candidatus Accumulibacter sp. ACC003]
MERFRFLALSLAGASLLAASLLTPNDALAASAPEQVFLFGGNFCPAGTRELDPKLGKPLTDMPACTAGVCPKGSVARVCVYEYEAEPEDRLMASIFLSSGNFCPRGTVRAEGQTLPVNQYSALFSLLGPMYGGDGQRSFVLPDLRGKGPLPVTKDDPRFWTYCLVLQGKYPSRP